MRPSSTIDLETFTPFDTAFIEAPYETFRTLRETSPAHKVDDLGYLITRYADAVEICRDPELFSSRFGPGIGGDMTLTPGMIAEIERRGELPPMVPTLLTTDPPEHRRYRSLSGPTFKPSRVRDMQASVQRRADELIDTFAGDGNVELVHQFAVRFPLIVICDLLGIPAEDIRHFDRWMKYGVSGLGGMLTDEEREDWFVGQLDMLDYLVEHVRRHREAPGADLVGDLVDARLATEEGLQPLDDAEIVSIALHYLVAGHETTAKLIGNGVWLLLTHPDQRALLDVDPSLLANCVEEVLRYESPVQSMTRTATRPTEVAGVELDEGDHCVIMIGAANRDPAQFSDPDRFDITRDNARTSIAFAHGEHFCLGANLARLEGAVAFQTLFGRLRDLRFTPGANDFSHQRTWVHRGFNHLHIDFRPA